MKQNIRQWEGSEDTPLFILKTPIGIETYNFTGRTPRLNAKTTFHAFRYSEYCLLVRKLKDILLDEQA